MTTATRSFLVLLVLLLIGLFTESLPQSPPEEKPRLKHFGSSLKNMKWDPEKKEAVVTERPTTNEPDDDSIIRIETSLVTSDVLVTDRRGNLIRGLNANDFAISEDGVPQEVGHFVLGNNVNRSRSIVLIIDYSRSQFPYIAESIEAAKSFVDKLGRRDRMAIVTDDVELLVDFTNDKLALKKGLDSLIDRNRGSKGFLGVGRKRPQFGRSAQYSALLATLNEAFDEEDQNPIIVFQTDGDELEYLRNSPIVYDVPQGLPAQLLSEVQQEVEGRRKLQRAGMTEFSLDDVYRAAEKSRASIYSIIPRTRLLDLSQDEQLRRLAAEDEMTVATWSAASSDKVKKIFEARQEARRKMLTPELLQARLERELKVQQALVDLAKLTGGWADFLETRTQTADIYNRILADINQRYIIGYYPTNKARDGKRRRITIEVKNHPEYLITSRHWYYAPGP